MILLTTANLEYRHRDRVTCANTLMDTGSQRTFISENLAKVLDLRTHHYEIVDVCVFGEDGSQRKVLPCTELEIASEGEDVKLRPLIVSSISDNLTNYDRNSLLQLHPYLRNLRLAPQCQGSTFSLDVLIGADSYWDIMNDDVIRGPEQGPKPVAVGSRFGFMVSGPTALFNDHQSGYTPNLETVLATIAESAPNIPEYFEVEKLGILPDLDPDTSFNFERYLAENIIQGPDNRYTASLPINDRIRELPSYYNVCVRVTREMVRKMPLQKRLAYHKIILEQYDRGFIEYTPETNSHDGHYLMHYGIEKSSSSSTPLRIVYRCNFKLGSSPSLNDCLYPGVPLLQDLGGILMRARLFDTLLAADIEKAFLHVKLAADHRKYTKFLWASDPHDVESPFVELQFTSVLFGACPSPFILGAVLHKHLQNNDCDTAERIARDIYVDNIVSSVPTRNLAEQYYHVANKILADGGFRLRAWTSNDLALQNRAIRDDIAMKGEKVNVLGMIWDKSADTLACKPIPPLNPKKPACPKYALSETARVFDVTGFLLPVHVRAKRLLQDFQRNKMKWKTPLPADKARLWEEIHKDLESATSHITWPRQIIKGLQPDTPVELHVFADSSRASFGAVAYLVANNQSAILWAKNTLIPVKDEQPRIPRYELNACVLAANLLSYIKDNIEDSLNITTTVLWSDSQIVLHWINSAKKLEIYVHRRVLKIRTVAFSEIRYSPTRDMPADLLTRGISTKQLQAAELWWHGPKWLLTQDYPSCEIKPILPTVVSLVRAQPRILDVIHEEDEVAAQHRECSISMNSICNVMDSTRFSSVTKLLRATVFAYHFARKLVLSVRGGEVPRVDRNVKAQDLHEAKISWIRHVQRLYYSNEISDIKKQTKRRTALVRQLNLFIDEKGILRKGSRMKNAPHLPMKTTYRIVLPRNHHFTSLIIRQLHAACLHDGLQHTLSCLRTIFWVSRDSVVVRRILKDCITCKRLNARHYNSPPTPDLPLWRLDSSRPPFTTVGVDYTGEVWIKDKSTGERRKVYIVLYTCAVTRGVHLHYVQNQSSEQFLLSFTQLCARKSMPSHMYSDNATTFIAADEILQGIMSDPSVRAYMTEHSILWQFIPKRAPWFGAIYERLIGIMKRNLVKVIGKALLTEYELATLLTKIEANMNDRPLTRCIMANDDDVIPITPANLIYGRRITPFPHVDTDPTDEPYVPKMTHEAANKTVQRLSLIHEHYSKRFNTEYVIALMDTHKLQSKADFHQNIKVGDIVLVHEDFVKRPQWKMAIISKLLPGPDGLIRAAEIRTSTGITNRPIVKLYPLELTLENYEVQAEPKREIVDNLEYNQNIIKRPARAAKTAAIEKIKQIADEIDS